MSYKNTKLDIENQKKCTIVLNIPKSEYNKFMTNNTFEKYYNKRNSL